MKTVAQRSVFGTPLAATPRIANPRARGATQIHSHKKDALVDVSAVATGVAISTTFLASQPVQAAQEFATLAEGGDSRLGAVAFLFVPAIAWVLFNITGPATRQLENMQTAKPKAKPAARKPAARKPAGKPAGKPARKPAPKKAPVKRAR